MKKIILLIDCSSEYDRKLLKGLVNYSKDHGPWLFYRMPSALIGSANGGEYIMQWAKRWKADAIIGRWRWKDTSMLSELNIPIILQNYSKRSERFSNLTGDYVGTGKIAATFFSNKGYKNFAYFGVKNVIWSTERLDGFRKVIENNYGTVNDLLVDDYIKEKDKVVKWLHSLPKPAGVFACDDEYALFLTEICKLEEIKIPDEIALMGVDNDELLCVISDPQISSIELDVEYGGGYKLGQILGRQFKQKEFRPFSVVVEPSRIIERGSTKSHNIKDRYVNEVVNYIDLNYDKYITIQDILEQVPLSRRSLEIRFKEEFGSMTIYKYLQQRRMGKFASLLTTTDIPVSRAAEMSGIINSENAARLFKSVYGCSPTDYRRKEKNKHQ